MRVNPQLIYHLINVKIREKQGVSDGILIVEEIFKKYVKKKKKKKRFI